MTTAAWAQTAIGIGDSREEVLRLLGKPNSTARRGEREIFLYPGGARVEFDGGKVVDVKGLAVTPGAATNPPAAASAGNEPAPTTPEPAATAPTPTPPSPSPPTSEMTEQEEEELPLGMAAALVAGMLIAQFGLTFAALKIAFHYQQMDALWSGILAITGIDVALQTAMTVVLYFQSGELRLGVAGTGLPGLAMIWSIRHFCLDQRWSRALATTSAVKIAAILLNLGLLALADRFVG